MDTDTLELQVHAHLRIQSSNPSAKGSVSFQPYQHLVAPTPEVTAPEEK
jgi:hypothetical protein